MAQMETAGLITYSLSQDWSTSFSPVVQFFYTVAVIAVVIALAYFTTRIVASAKMGRMSKRNLEIVETIGVGQQTFVHIIRIGERHVLVGVTRAQVTFLADVDASELEFSEPKNLTFDSLLSRFQRKDGFGEDNWLSRFQKKEEPKDNHDQDKMQ